jgi:hypothetical protein
MLLHWGRLAATATAEAKVSAATTTISAATAMTTILAIAIG